MEDDYGQKNAYVQIHSLFVIIHEELYMEIETFPTLTKDLYRLLKWLEDHEVTHIAMESTGVY